MIAEKLESGEPGEEAPRITAAKSQRQRGGKKKPDRHGKKKNQCRKLQPIALTGLEMRQDSAVFGSRVTGSRAWIKNP